MAWVAAAFQIGSQVAGLGESAKASRRMKFANAFRAKATALKNFRERRQLVREAYVKRAEIVAGAAASDGDLGLSSTPVLNSLFSVLGRQQQELDFLARFGELDVKAAKYGAGSDSAQAQAGLFAGLGNVVGAVNQSFPNLFGGGDQSTGGGSGGGSMLNG